jgi:hypothetical protein
MRNAVPRYRTQDQYQGMGYEGTLMTIYMLILAFLLLQLLRVYLSRCWQWTRAKLSSSNSSGPQYPSEGAGGAVFGKKFQ